MTFFARCLNAKITESFHYFEDPIDVTRTLRSNGGRINGVSLSYITSMLVVKGTRQL